MPSFAVATRTMFFEEFYVTLDLSSFKSEFACTSVTVNNAYCIRLQLHFVLSGWSL